MKSRTLGVVLATILAVGGCMLGFYQRITDAAPPAMPFAAAERREEIVAQLREVNAQLKELNALLRSGEVKVITRPEEKK